MSKKIYLLGDVGHFNKHTLNILNSIENNSNDFIFLLGDNFYPYGITSIMDERVKRISEIFPKELTILPILGNHDYLGNPYHQLKLNLKNWNFPNFFHKKTIFNFDFFFIDSVILQPNFSSTNEDLMRTKIHNYEQVKEDMICWLIKELSDSNKNKIVLGHYPILSMGIYGINKELFDMVIDIFEKYDVKMYISGHDHNLQICNLINEETKYSLKHVISGSSSDVYNYSSFSDLKDNGKIFHLHGYGKILVKEKSDIINFQFCDENGNIIHEEKISFI